MKNKKFICFQKEKIYPGFKWCDQDFLERASGEVLRGDKNRPKRENYITGIDRLVMSFDGKTYKSGKKFFMIEWESKDERDSYMKVATDAMFTKMSAKAGINKFVEKEVEYMVK